MQKKLEKDKANEYLVAHRGFTAEYPENTLMAIQGALDADAKYIEIDIQLTKDKKVVVFHDRDMQRLCHQQKAIHDYNLSELELFSSYSPERFGNKFLGEKIPCLSDVVSLVKKYPEVTLFVELKRNSIEVFGADTIIDKVLPLISSIKNQCIIISFSLDIIEKIRLCSDYAIGAVIDDWNEAVTTQFERLNSIRPEYFFCDIDSLPKDKKIKLLDCLIVSYECTNEKRAFEVLQQGVDFVETFDIKQMIEKLNMQLSPKI